ncbi:TPA: hypothetical protein ME439_000374 [Klebsiella pneumoniae]|nr:hypothetical protein LOCUS_44000 [Klebsiella pneumoniae]HBW4304403.1 hypothetical protein [Klebsiella pneumoniae]
MFAGKKSAQIREILISESAWEEMTCLFAPSLKGDDIYFSEITLSPKRGKLKITPSIWDAKLGSMWDLSLAKTGSIEPVYSCP